MLSGLAFTAARRSLKSLKGVLGCTAMAIPPVPMNVTGARSFMVSKERFGMSEGLTEWVSNTTAMVWPSGAALASAAVPIEPEAPPLF